MTGGRDGARPKTGRSRVAPVARATLLSLTVVLVVIGAVLLFGRDDFGRIVWGLPGAPILWALGFSAAGYPITRRHPANPVGWCLMVGGVAAGVALTGLGLGGNSAAAGPGDPALWLVSAWLITVGALSSAMTLFPSGSPPSRWWWMQLGVLWGSGVLAYFAAPYKVGGRFVDPPGLLEYIAAPVTGVFQLSVVAGLFSLLARLRRSGPGERSQLKWVVYGVALAGTTGLAVETGIVNLAPAWHPLGTVVLSVVLLAVPASMLVAMLRHRLYDIDTIINRTLIYASLTVVLVGIYVGTVVALQYALNAATGQQNPLAIVASTLLIAALFNPLRRAVQALIDRRFYRGRYDAAGTLRAFSARMRDETDLDALNDDLVVAVGKTMRPAHVSLWLREPRSETYEGDT
jgi:hypothetical protein